MTLDAPCLPAACSLRTNSPYVITNFVKMTADHGTLLILAVILSDPKIGASNIS